MIEVVVCTVVVVNPPGWREAGLVPTLVAKRANSGRNAAVVGLATGGGCELEAENGIVAVVRGLITRCSVYTS
jgi:hypothetical protein